MRKTLQERQIEAETRANTYLADANEASESGNEVKAEKLYAKGQFWRDRMNLLYGNGDRAPIVGEGSEMTEVPFDMEKGDAALLAKALKAYRPDTAEDELTLDLYVDQFTKMADNERASQEEPGNVWKGAETPFADNH